MVNKNYVISGAWGSKGNAFGLRSFEYIPQTRSLNPIGAFGTHASMSCVVADGNLLFSCVESKKDDLLLSFRIMPDGTLQALGELHIQSYGISDLNIDRAHQCIFTSNFASGSVSMVSYDSEGVMTLRSSFTAPDPGSFVVGYSKLERQNASHPHCTRMMPDGQHLCLCDMGNDRLYILDIDFDQAEMRLCPEKTFINDPGEGARNIAFSPDGRYAYMNTEMGCSVYAFSVGADSGLTRLQKLSTLKPGVENPEKGWCSVTVVSPDGRHVYVGNRGQNNLAVYNVDSTGMLTCAGYFDCGGVSPRGLSFWPDGSVLFCSCNGSGTISVLDIDAETGAVAGCGQLVEGIPGAANVAWGAACV